ncbi:hypothetical protein DERP_004836 [Dermatophagoides pteronyssinus]|uniref:Uncharacterized protein n=1 Tax=Dermatophagoides pteronyssinus TaxID=6956 RepID=A0ABQ8JTP3_DERPT|nr:hypothetical protein DERP_004836 [Dermatophagoides pteronyssinus]
MSTLKYCISVMEKKVKSISKDIIQNGFEKRRQQRHKEQLSIKKSIVIVVMIISIDYYEPDQILFN